MCVALSLVEQQNGIDPVSQFGHFSTIQSHITTYVNYQSIKAFVFLERLEWDYIGSYIASQL